MPLENIANLPYPDRVDDLRGVKDYLCRLYRSLVDTEMKRPEAVTRLYYSKDELETSGDASVHWDNITNEPTTYAPAAHDLTSAYHTDSGLTIGHFLKASGATAFGFAAHGLTYSDVGASATAHTHEYYAVGDIFITTRIGAPNTLLGYGTWSAIEAKFLVGYKSGDADFGTVSGAGGAKTSTPDAHAGTAVAAHAAGTTGGPSGTVAVQSGAGADPGSYNHTHTIGEMAHTVTQPSAHAAMSILPPYYTAYMWLRTA